MIKKINGKRLVASIMGCMYYLFLWRDRKGLIIRFIIIGGLKVFTTCAAGKYFHRFNFGGRRLAGNFQRALPPVRIVAGVGRIYINLGNGNTYS